jgi:protein PhnA
MEVKDCNGNLLKAGDTVTVTKTLKVKGLSSDIKQGTTIKNIRITDDVDSIEGKVNGTLLVIKTMYLKKR